uniref:Uncharacterized protein n=1 Tax=Cannabis sativa TaxID=3483 RepID=A0A803QHK6_CANSA
MPPDNPPRSGRKLEACWPRLLSKVKAYARVQARKMKKVDANSLGVLMAPKHVWKSSYPTAPNSDPSTFNPADGADAGARSFVNDYFHYLFVEP